MQITHPQAKPIDCSRHRANPPTPSDRISKNQVPCCQCTVSLDVISPPRTTQLPQEPNRRSGLSLAGAKRNFDLTTPFTSRPTKVLSTETERATETIVGLYRVQLLSHFPKLSAEIGAVQPKWISEADFLPISATIYNRPLPKPLTRSREYCDSSIQHQIVIQNFITVYSQQQFSGIVAINKCLAEPARITQDQLIDMFLFKNLSQKLRPFFSDFIPAMQQVISIFPDRATHNFGALMNFVADDPAGLNRTAPLSKSLTLLFNNAITDNEIGVLLRCFQESFFNINYPEFLTKFIDKKSQLPHSEFNFEAVIGTKIGKESANKIWLSIKDSGRQPAGEPNNPIEPARIHGYPLIRSTCRQRNGNSHPAALRTPRRKPAPATIKPTSTRRRKNSNPIDLTPLPNATIPCTGTDIYSQFDYEISLMLKDSAPQNRPFGSEGDFPGSQLIDQSPPSREQDPFLNFPNG